MKKVLNVIFIIICLFINTSICCAKQKHIVLNSIKNLNINGESLITSKDKFILVIMFLALIISYGAFIYIVFWQKNKKRLENRMVIIFQIVALVFYFFPTFNYFNDNKLKIEMNAETEGNAKYLTKVLKKVNIYSEKEIKEIKYCITTKNTCKPNISVEMDDDENYFEVNYPNDSLPQRICMYVINEDGIWKNLCDNKTYLVDNIEPELELKNGLVEIDTINYDAKDNIKTEKYSVSGGKTECDIFTNLGDGEYEASCSIIGNNGLIKKSTFKLRVSVTKDKTAIFYGDSITEGLNNDNYSWANYINDNYNLSYAINRGKSGWTISNLENKWINSMVVEDKKNNYDFVILHGGCNDVAYKVNMGIYEDNNFSGEYDEKTYLGGLETYLYNVTKQWPNAKIGYIINYQTPNNPERSNEKSLIYYEEMKKVLEKWNISYLDLYDGKNKESILYSDILKVNTNIYLSDNLHLNNEGYNVISPYIYEWMRTLPHYSRK